MSLDLERQALPVEVAIARKRLRSRGETTACRIQQSSTASVVTLSTS
ncbi:MAG TPA: hypothetical protein VMY37_00570 [Thermoguttaceae bacterium]|nr:hypothetical protein [Thermoguttaceae bacterium]